jgi:hypothetical protein
MGISEGRERGELFLAIAAYSVWSDVKQNGGTRGRREIGVFLAWPREICGSRLAPRHRHVIGRQIRLALTSRASAWEWGQQNQNQNLEITLFQRQSSDLCVHSKCSTRRTPPWLSSRSALGTWKGQLFHSDNHANSINNNPQRKARKLKKSTLFGFFLENSRTALCKARCPHTSLRCTSLCTPPTCIVSSTARPRGAAQGA